MGSSLKVVLSKPNELYTVAVVVLLLAWTALRMSFLSGIVIWMSAWLFFIAFENNFIHSAQEHENRFVIFMGMYLAFTVLFTHDSPMGRIGQNYPRFGIILVFGCGFMLANWARSSHREALAAPIKIAGSMRRTSSHPDHVDKVVIKQVVDEVILAIRTLDKSWMPSAPDVIKWLNSSVEMGAVQRALENTNALELNEVLLKLAAYQPREMELADIEEGGEDAKNFISLAIYKVKDGWSHGARTKLLKFFCEDRLSDLNTFSRVLVLHALQQLRISASPRAAFYVRQILTTTSFGDLIRLKLEMDSKGSYHSLHKLIFIDLHNVEERNNILSHMEKEAKSILSLMKLGGRLGQKMLNARPWRKVLSDIDDTLKCSGGHFPAGCDLSLPRKAIYPGVLGLYREIDLGDTEASQWERSASEIWPSSEFSFLRRDVGNLVFLSARPHVFKDWSEASQYKHFIELHGSLSDGASMHAIPTLLPGDLVSGAEFIRHGEFTPLAIKKYTSFKQFASLWPEFRHVFIGDNGQGDVRAAELMMGLGGTSPTEFKVEVAYINRVRRTELTFGEGNPVSWREHGIIFVDNFVEAAVHAAMSHQCKRVLTSESGRSIAPLTTKVNGTPVALISPCGLYRICKEAAADFLQLDDPKQPRYWNKMGSIGAWARESYRQRLQQSLNAAFVTLQHLKKETKPIKLQSKCHFAPGTLVSIRRSPGARALAQVAPCVPVPPLFGGKGCDGIVRSFRPSDGMYKVELLGWRLAQDKPVHLFATLYQLSPVGLADDEISRVRSSGLGFKCGRVPQYSIVVGCTVNTPMGKAKVIEIKKADKQKIVVVKYGWWDVEDKSTKPKHSPMGYIRIEDVAFVAAPPIEPPKPSTVSGAQHAIRGGSMLIKRFLTSPFGSDTLIKKTAERLFDDGCAVKTPYGNGQVLAFREDGMYKVKLKWGALAFLRPSLLSLRCEYPIKTLVMTSFGIAGELVEVRAGSGIHVVSVPSRQLDKKKSQHKPLKVDVANSPDVSPLPASSPGSISSLDPKLPSLSLDSIDPSLPALKQNWESASLPPDSPGESGSSPTGVRAAGRVAKRYRPRALSLGAAAEVDMEESEEEPLGAGELAGFGNKHLMNESEVPTDVTEPPANPTRRFFLPAALTSSWPSRVHTERNNVEPQVVAHPCTSMKLYLQPDQILGLVVALPGQTVRCHVSGSQTNWVEGVVVSVRKDEMYEVALTGWSMLDSVPTAVLRSTCISADPGERPSSWWAGVKFW